MGKGLEASAERLGKRIDRRNAHNDGDQLDVRRIAELVGHLHAPVALEPMRLEHHAPRCCFCGRSVIVIFVVCSAPETRRLAPLGTRSPRDSCDRYALGSGPPGAWLA